GKDESERTAVGTCQGANEKNGDKGTGKAGKRQRQRKECRKAGIDGEHRAEGSCAADAENAWFRKRIAEKSLQDRSRQAKRYAYHEAKNGSRQPNLVHDELSKRCLGREESFKTAGHSEIRRADEERADECQDHEPRERSQQDRIGGRPHFSLCFPDWTAALAAFCRMAAATRLKGPPQIQFDAGTGAVCARSSTARSAGWTKFSCASAGASYV